MARPKLSGVGTGNPLSVRLTDAVKEQFATVAKRMNMEVADLMRFTMRIGLEHLDRIDYNVAKCIVDAVEKQSETEDQTPQLQKTPHVTAVASSSTSAEAPSPAIPIAKLAKFPRPTTPEPELKVAGPVAEYKFTDRTKKKGA